MEIFFSPGKKKYPFKASVFILVASCTTNVKVVHIISSLKPPTCFNSVGLAAVKHRKSSEHNITPKNLVALPSTPKEQDYSCCHSTGTKDFYFSRRQKSI